MWIRISWYNSVIFSDLHSPNIRQKHAFFLLRLSLFNSFIQYSLCLSSSNTHLTAPCQLSPLLSTPRILFILVVMIPSFHRLQFSSTTYISFFLPPFNNMSPLFHSLIWISLLFSICFSLILPFNIPVFLSPSSLYIIYYYIATR